MDPDNQNIGYLLNKATQRLKWRLSARLEQHGVTISQWSVLRDLAAQSQLPPDARQLTPAQIAARLEMDRPTLSGILDRLAKKSWVKIRTNPEDRRSQLVELTDESEALIPQLGHESHWVLAAALQGIDVEELERLQASLIKLIHNMDEGV